MPTLSLVMTDCGANETTCSRRSVLGNIWSIMGTMNVSPLWAVRWYRPKRCTIPTRLCGTTFTVCARKINTTIITTTTAISENTTLTSIFDFHALHQRHQAVGVQDPPPRARLYPLIRVHRPGGPKLAVPYTHHPARARVDG